MPSNAEAPIVISADTTGFDEAMRDISASTEQFGRIFASTMSRAVLSGRDLDDTLRSIALRFADLALSKALSPLENAVSNLIGGLAGGAAQANPSSGPALPQIVFNVATQDAGSFGQSQGQIAALLARAVGLGQRSL
jgi:phage-related minor tail protein